MAERKTESLMRDLNHLQLSTRELRESGDLARLADRWAEVCAELQRRLKMDVRPRHDDRGVERGTVVRWVTEWEVGD